MQQLEARALDCQFVRVRTDRLDGQELFGISAEGVSGDCAVNRVYDFLTKQWYVVAAVHCRVIMPHNVTQGFTGLLVHVHDFGRGHVVKEWFRRGVYYARVQDGLLRSVVVTIGMFTILIPRD